jgi:hypothetical protein
MINVAHELNTNNRHLEFWHWWAESKKYRWKIADLALKSFRLNYKSSNFSKEPFRKAEKKPEETLRDMETINYPYTGNETEHFEHSVHVELSKWHKRENVKLIESLNKALPSNCDCT